MRARNSWWLALAAVLLAAGPLLAQLDDSQQQVPDPMPVPPPLPPPDTETTEEAHGVDSVVPESDAPWGLPEDLLDTLRGEATRYEEFARRFTCHETVRFAEYDGTGEVSKEHAERYDYLLISTSGPAGIRESREVETKSGELKAAEAEVEPFPPAYAWVFLFSKFHEPYFAFRRLATRFDGFDLVHEIQFRGSLSFTNGQDIRQWEGVVLVDAFRLTPLEVRAEPKAQKERLEELYRAWAQSFNIMGFRTGKTPLGYRAHVQFRLAMDNGLNFPTELRYDTFRATSPSEVIPVRASTRSYANYRFFGTRDEQQMGDPVPAEPPSRP